MENEIIFYFSKNMEFNNVKCSRFCLFLRRGGDLKLEALQGTDVWLRQLKWVGIFLILLLISITSLIHKLINSCAV